MKGERGIIPGLFCGTDQNLNLKLIQMFIKLS
jgi:hypothetical protein